MANRFKSRWELEEEDHESYLKKKEEELERRRAKKEAEGFKCTKEGCGHSFHDFLEFQAHVKEHQDECRKNMICNQAKCGEKFNNRRAYNEHIESHKEEAKAKVLKNIRSVLLLNKHGLLMESFEREFKSIMGKHVPYKMMGFNSSYDLVTNIPDVVQVSHLNGGQTLLIGVPDKSTEHIATMVSNQRSNRDGYNYRNGEVLASVGRDVLNKIAKVVDKSYRIVPEFMKKQVQQLIDMDIVEGGEGLDLVEFQEIYDQEFGYPLEFQTYGFYSMEDFVQHGLSDLVDLTLDGYSWKVVATAGSSIANHTSVTQTVAQEIRQNMKKLLEENPYGMSGMTLIRLYEEMFGRLEMRKSRCGTIAEMCMLMPDICRVHISDSEDITILPVGDTVSISSASSPPWVLGEVKNNIHKILKTLSGDVPLSAFLRGYEGLYGILPVYNILELCRSMPDVCNLKLGRNGEFTVAMACTNSTNTTTFPRVQTIVRQNVTRVFKKCGGSVKLENFFGEYIECTGESIDPQKMGFPNFKSLLRSLSLNYVVKREPSGVETLLSSVTLKSPKLISSDGSSSIVLKTGWFNLVTCISPDLIYLQTDSMTSKMWALEEEMEEFYTVQKLGQQLAINDVSIGQLVAAIGEDTLWHRGRVDMVNIRAGVAKIFFIDHGYTAFNRLSTLKLLPPQLCREVRLAIGVSLKGVSYPGQRWCEETVTGLQDIITSGKKRGWVQKSEGNQVDIFVIMPNLHGLGKMVTVSKMLVQRGLALYTGQSPELERGEMLEGVKEKVVNEHILSEKMAMQRMVLSAMAKIA